MNRFLPLAAVLCLSLFFSCTTDVEPPPPPQNGSIKYCVYQEIQQCFETTQTVCPAGGELSDFCLFSVPSSSSNQIEQSSGDAEPKYGYCVFAADGVCLDGPVSVCPPGGTLSNRCPYSSGSGVPSSSSSVPSSPSVEPSSSSVVPSSPSVVPSSPSGELPTSIELAAIIYDTDASVHPDFSCSLYYMGADEGNGPNARGACEEGPTAYSGARGNLKPNCRGVTKGLVKPNLNPATRKIECDNCTKLGCWTDASWFSKAFASTPSVNVERCYNMPLVQNATGNYYVFDSDKLVNANGRLVGGFFPELLNNAPADANCPSCNTKRTAERFPPRIKELTTERFDAYESREGDFKDGDTSLKLFGITNTTTSSESIYDWVARDTTSWYLHGNMAIKGSEKGSANQHFCFESHANFTYSPEQVFYISGDDDIWVYINNNLVIDLGGNHMAAPDHVNLNLLKLTEGQIYPIDIFFCDRRTTSASIRISTNIPLTQTAEQKGTCGGR